MADPGKLRQLQKIANLVRDRDLSRLSLAGSQKTKTEALLAALSKTCPIADLDPVVAAQIVDRFGLWTTNRRITLNQQLARETVCWLEAKANAQKSFGKADVLGRLIVKK